MISKNIRHTHTRACGIVYIYGVLFFGKSHGFQGEGAATC